MRSLAKEQYPSSENEDLRKKHEPRAVPRGAIGSAQHSAILQRKAGCTCRGRCPRCREHEGEDDLALQPKLKINRPGDCSEQEAERVADEVMRMPESTGYSPVTATPVQHQVDGDGSERPRLSCAMYSAIQVSLWNRILADSWHPVSVMTLEGYASTAIGRLLAHELAHVVQGASGVAPQVCTQRGGRPARLKSRARPHFQKTRYRENEQHPNWDRSGQLPSGGARQLQ